MAFVKQVCPTAKAVIFLVAFNLQDHSDLHVRFDPARRDAHLSAFQRMSLQMPPLLDNKNPEAKSVFAPSALLREARRQKGLAPVNVPSVCVLDPDGDIVRYLKATGQAHRQKDW